MAWKTFVNDVEFLAQYPYVGQAIVDSTSPTPGYLYGEINALTYVESGTKCKPLINFLAAQLQADAPQVSLKVLKLLLYLVKNGHKEVINDVKLQEIPLKKAMGFHGPPDEFHGNVFYENIRKMAKEILEFVFDDTATSASPNICENQIPGSIEMDAYGSSASTKKLTGFGFTVKTPKTVTEKVTGGLTTLVEKLLPSSNIKEEKSEIQSSFLGEALPQYKPITIDKGPQFFPESPAPINTQSQIPHILNKAKRKTRVHRVGKPGGGWNDSDEELEVVQDAVNDDPSKQSTISLDSLENSLKQDLQSGLEWVDEHQVVNEFTVNEPLEALKFENIMASCKRCSSLNCDKILAFLIDKLSEKDENVKLRALVFIEYLLHNDVVTLESLIKIVLPPLEKEIIAPKSSVQTKSKKICLIIKSLSNYQRESLQNTKASFGSPLKCSS